MTNPMDPAYHSEYYTLYIVLQPTSLAKRILLDIVKEKSRRGGQKRREYYIIELLTEQLGQLKVG